MITKALDVKASGCPHCDSPNYIKNANDKASRRYKCKNCGRRFTEHTALR